MEKENILAVVDKYQDYFEQWNAGVAMGIKGDNIFYVIDEHGMVELFTRFQTAERLEGLILGTLAENASCILEMAADSLSLQFSRLDMAEDTDADGDAASGAAVREYQDVTEYIPILAKELSLVHEEYKQWSHMIELITKSLENVEFH